jgi:amidohydrolase
MSVLSDAAELAPELRALRRDIHQYPETGPQLHRTRRTVLAAIDDLPLEITTGKGLSSVTAVLHGGAARGPAPSVLLRADMDALPLHEPDGLPYASVVPGAMHACGHDLHTAMLVGAARLLSARRARLAGDVILMFQPGEEGHGGARMMLAEGVLEAAGAPPLAAYAVHVAALADRGVFFHRAGAQLAAASTLRVLLRGRGGHGAWPHRALDPVPAAAETILAWQQMVTRSFDALDPVVLSVGTLRAGTTPNVIPGEVSIAASLRAVSDDTMSRLAALATDVAHGIASAHGLTADVEHRRGLPVTWNDPAEADFLGRTIAGLFGAERFRVDERPGMTSDDMARVLREVPGVLTSLGARPADVDPAKGADHHTPGVLFDDSVIADGAALLTTAAMARLDAERAARGPSAGDAEDWPPA